MFLCFGKSDHITENITSRDFPVGFLSYGIMLVVDLNFPTRVYGCACIGTGCQGFILKPHIVLGKITHWKYKINRFTNSEHK